MHGGFSIADHGDELADGEANGEVVQRPPVPRVDGDASDNQLRQVGQKPSSRSWSSDHGVGAGFRDTFPSTFPTVRVPRAPMGLP